MSLRNLVRSVVAVADEWGSTPEERAAPYPCDRHLAAADRALFRAVDVAAPAAVVFRWLCQLKVAPYSYDWIDNLGRRSPRRLTPGLERLQVGDRVMTMFDLVEFEADRHLTMRMRTRSPALFGEIAVSYVVVPRPGSRARLVVKLLVRDPQGPLGCITAALLPWGDLVMMRKQLLTLKALAERQAGDAARTTSRAHDVTPHPAKEATWSRQPS